MTDSKYGWEKTTEIASMYYNMKEIYNIYLIKYNKKSANFKNDFIYSSLISEVK